MSSKTDEVSCRHHTEFILVTTGIICVNAILIFCVAVLFGYKSIKYIEAQQKINQPVCKTARYYITFCIFSIIILICSHITLLWIIVNCLTQLEKFLEISYTVHAITIFVSGCCGASIFTIRLQLVFENTMFAIKKSTLNLLYFGSALIAIGGTFSSIILNFHLAMGFFVGTITFGVYMVLCAVIIKLFVQGLINVAKFGLKGKQVTTDAEKEAVLMSVPPHIKDLIDIMSKFSILVLICFISTLINLISFGLRGLLIVIFNGNVSVALLVTTVNNLIYSTDLLINSICLTLQFHYFGNNIYDKHCTKLHNACKNMVINHVFNNTDQQSPNVTTITVV